MLYSLAAALQVDVYNLARGERLAGNDDVVSELRPDKRRGVDTAGVERMSWGGSYRDCKEQPRYSHSELRYEEHCWFG